MRRLRLSRADEETREAEVCEAEVCEAEVCEAEASHKSRVAIARTNDSS